MFVPCLSAVLGMEFFLIGRLVEVEVAWPHQDMTE